MVEGRAVGCLVGLHQHQPFLLCNSEEFPGLFTVEGHGRLTEHMAAVIQGIAGLAVVGQVRRGYIDSIHFLHQLLE